MKNVLMILLFILPMTAFTAPTYPVVTLKNPFSGSSVYSANTAEKKPGIIKLHGSEGGSEYYGNVEASTLATLGYTVMAYCYFDCNRDIAGLRQTLKNVELAKLFEAINWLRSLPSNNGKVYVYGASRGAELALIVASLSETFKVKVDGVIAHAPSDTYNQPYNWSWSTPACWLCVKGQGKCDKNSAQTDFFWNFSCGEYDLPLMYGPNSAWLLNGNPVPSKTRIEIEKYNGPILITVGEKDTVWPAEQTHRIEATLKEAGKTPIIHYFPDAGHGFYGLDEINRKNLVVEFLNAH